MVEDADAAPYARCHDVNDIAGRLDAEVEIAKTARIVRIVISLRRVLLGARSLEGISLITLA